MLMLMFIKILIFHIFQGHTCSPDLTLPILFAIQNTHTFIWHKSSFTVICYDIKKKVFKKKLRCFMLFNNNNFRMSEGIERTCFLKSLLQNK